MGIVFRGKEKWDQTPAQAPHSCSKEIRDSQLSKSLTQRHNGGAALLNFSVSRWIHQSPEGWTVVGPQSQLGASEGTHISDCQAPRNVAIPSI